MRSKEEDFKVMKQEIAHVEPEKLSKDNSYPSMQSFRELDYLEHMSKSRYQLLYKYPFFMFLAGSLYFKKKVVKAHNQLIKKSFYLRIDRPEKKMHNGLQFGLLVLYVGNFSSLLIGLLFSGAQYIYGLNIRYMKPIDYELELRKKYINDIKCYNRILHN